MKVKLKFLCCIVFMLATHKIYACSGTHETALCNIIHNQNFLANSLIWIGEPVDSCIAYTSYAGKFEACGFLITEILYGNVNKNDSVPINP